MIATLFFIILTASTGQYQADYKEFPTKEACEQVRMRLVAHAVQQENMWLISNCGVGDEPVALNIFFNGTQHPAVPLNPKNST